MRPGQGNTPAGDAVAPARPIPLVVEPAGIPEELRRERRWVLWSYEWNGRKWTKVPYRAGAPALKASSTDSSTWSTFEKALAAWEDGKADGIGFVLGDGWSGLDLDFLCFDEAGELLPVARDFVEPLKSYAERSPSGEKLHVLTRGELPEGRRKKDDVEMYSSGRYFTVTGHHIPVTPAAVEERTRELAELHARVFASNGDGRRRAHRRATKDDRRTIPSSVLSPDAEPPEKFAALLENDETARRTWEGRRSDLSDSSPSGYDLALANVLVQASYTDTEIVSTLIALRRRNGWALKLRPDYFRRTLARARDGHERTDTAAKKREDVKLEDFHAYMPMHNYIFAPTRELWPASSVNGRIKPKATGKKDESGRETKIKASVWLDEHAPVEQMTWAPGEPMLIEDRIVSEGGWIEREGLRVFNLYRPPSIEPGNPRGADRWLELVHRVYPRNGDHIVRWFAHRVQCPETKVNHALVLGGEPGIGKDTILEPVKQAVGPWNVAEVSPAQILSRFNGYLKSVILRISEARDLGESNRYSFYEHSKTYTAAPPDVLRCDEKHIREHAVFNVCGVVLTTNHQTDGIYLPGNDRRHFVAWSELTPSDFTADYWTSFYRWLETGGHEDVTAYLRELDISRFDPKAPPPKTDAFWAIVEANRAPEDQELADVLDYLQSPDAITIPELALAADSINKPFAEWLRDRGNSRKIPHRLEGAGYVPVRNSGQTDGRWKCGGQSRVVYVRQELRADERLTTAERHAASFRGRG